jgi:hypothetical protein
VTGRTTPIYGPEPWHRMEGAAWSHWDLWFCLVCITDFGGDWRALERVIVESRRRSFGGRDWEAKDSHVHDLEARLLERGIDAHVLAGGHRGNKTVLAKARRKVLEQGLAGRDLTPAMVDTPRRRLRARALRGRWDRFPVSPAADCDAFAAVIEKARRQRRGSFRTATRLVERAGELDAERAEKPAERLAVWRGLATAIVEAFGDGLRDPEGAYARCGGEDIARYVDLPRERAGIAADDYYQDLCELCVWDEWALLHRRETAPFRGIPRQDAPLVEEILWELEAEHRASHLEHQAEEAAQLVAWLHVATRTLDSFVPIAERLGCDWWMPVTAMAETAIAAGDTELAVRVFAAATSREGMQRDYLLQKCFALTGRSLEPGPHLRVVR